MRLPRADLMHTTLRVISRPHHFIQVKIRAFRQAHEDKAHGTELLQRGFHHAYINNVLL